MCCDYVQETCLEITWTDLTNNLLKVDHYVFDDYTKGMYFQVDSDDFSNILLELEIKFQPVQIMTNGEFNYDIQPISTFQEFSPQIYSSYQLYKWLGKYLLDWANPFISLENITNGSYIKKNKPRIISGIKLIKRNEYLNKYYY